MSWNQDLYEYIQSVGGICFGSVESRAATALAQLTHRGRPLILCASRDAGRGSVCPVWGRALLMAELARPYRLTLRGKNPLERGLQLLSRKGEAGENPLEQRIQVKSENDSFTRLVLQSPALRAVLQDLLPQWQGLRLSVCPAAEHAALHLVEAGMDWGVEGMGRLSELVTEEEGPLNPAAAFGALTQSVCALYDAVVEYPMG